MSKILSQRFLKNRDGLFVLNDKFTFWEFFKMIRKNDYTPDETLSFIFASCSLNALVFQECIDNKRYESV
jgi:hypothetical protein